MTAAPGFSATCRHSYVRKETVLARVPRKWKLGAVAVIAVIILLPLLWPEDKTPDRSVTAHGSSSAPEPFSQTALPRQTTASDPAAVALNDSGSGAQMAHAPDPGLTEDTASGGLPRIGEDGRKPWQVYARPFVAGDHRPRIALVVVDMGLSSSASDAVLRRLPPQVTLAFDSQSPVVGAWLGRARQQGHETLLSLPMEPFDYPRSDPGPDTLLTSLPDTDNIERLEKALKRGTGYVGITSVSGSRLTADPAKLAPVLDTLQQRGLLVLDARVTPHSVARGLAKKHLVPVAEAALWIDREPTPAAINAALDQLEQTARLTGKAVGLVTPLPLAVGLLENWVKQLPGRGVALAPVSAVVE